MDWPSVDWTALDRLRAIFLSGRPPGSCYWQSRSDLASYDCTFAQRIAWKWDAVLRELARRGWRPAGRSVLDWGCGSGIAARRVVAFFGPDHFDAVRFHDQSSLAEQFAVETARKEFPQLSVGVADPDSAQGAAPVGLLLLSHVLSELTPQAEAALWPVVQAAAALIWVEPGARELSRRLLGWRERLRAQFTVLAPCTHQAACGLLMPANERHWCHHFADPPPALLADAAWVRFARRAGLDLRSLPYSFLALQKSPAQLSSPDRGDALTPAAGLSRIIGRPRLYKGYAKVFSCQADGVWDLTLLKRSAPALFKQLGQGGETRLYRWAMDGERIVGGQPMSEASG